MRKLVQGWGFGTLLSLAALGVVVLAVVPLAVFNARETGTLLQERGRERLYHFARHTADRIDDHLEMLVRWGRNNGERPGLLAWLRRADPADLAGRTAWEDEVLRPFQSLYGLPGVLIAAPDGRVLVQVGSLSLHTALADWPTFQRAAQGADGPSDVMFIGPGGTARLFVLGTVRGPDGRVVAVTLIEDDLSAIREYITQDSDAEGPDSYGTLLDDDLIRLVHSSEPRLEGVASEGLDPARREALLAARRVLVADPTLTSGLRTQVERLRRERTPRVFASHHQVTTGGPGFGVLVPLRTVPWLYYMGVPAVYFDEPVARQMGRTAVTALGLLVLVGGGAVLLARRLTRRLRALATVAAAQGAAAPLATARAEEAGPREFVELARAFNAMTARLASASEDLERQVRARTAELQETNDQLEMFSYSASHDLRAPLRSIQAYASAVVEDCGPALPADARHDLERILALCLRMDRLVEDLLDLGRIQRQSLKREPVDLGAIAGACIEELRREDPHRQVRLVLTGDLQTRADPRLVEIALGNLLRNAWKFTRRQEVATVEVGVVRRGGAPEFFVRDDGVGFEPDDAGRLFAPFQRLHSAREFAGHGIGLTIVRRVVDRHGGWIRAEGNPGVGATFIFTLE